MKLSINIPPHEWALGLITEGIPQIKMGYAAILYPNGGINSHPFNWDAPRLKDKALRSFIESSNSGWYTAQETPMQYQQQIGQTSLEHELERDILFLCLPLADGSQIGLFLKLVPLVLSHTTYLSAAEKKVLEVSIRGLLKACLTQRQRDNEILKQIAGSNEHLRTELGQLHKKVERGNATFESTLKQLLGLLLAKFEQQYGLRIQYTPAFTQAIMEYHGPFGALEEHLEKQVSVEANLAQLNDEMTIWLDQVHLAGFKGSTPKTKEGGLPLHLGRLSKAYALLDRYEQAAELAMNNGLSIIGKHIGAHCDPPISNAAITDALNKNGKKIVELFEKYPDRWPIIRSDFRSVANVIEKVGMARQAG